MHICMPLAMALGFANQHVGFNNALYCDKRLIRNTRLMIFKSIALKSFVYRDNLCIVDFRKHRDRFLLNGPVVL